jgi:hypothetical protein
MLVSAVGVLGLVLVYGPTWYASVVNRPSQDPAPQTLEAAGDDVIWGATGRIV